MSTDGGVLPVEGSGEQMAETDRNTSQRPSLDELDSVMSNIRRRYVIYYAKQAGQPIHFDDLVEKIAAWETPHGAADATRSHRKSIHNALQQTHLPKLEQAELLNYDTESDLINLTDEAKRVKIYPASETSEWRIGYILLSCGMILLFGLESLGLILFTPQTGIPWVEGLFLAFVTLTVGHSYDHARRRRQFRDYGPDLIIEETH